MNPPVYFVVAVMEFAMMDSAERHGEFIADFFWPLPWVVQILDDENRMVCGCR